MSDITRKEGKILKKAIAEELEKLHKDVLEQQKKHLQENAKALDNYFAVFNEKAKKDIELEVIKAMERWKINEL